MKFLSILFIFLNSSFLTYDESTTFIKDDDCYYNFEYEDLPGFQMSEFEERWDPWYQTHYTSTVNFSDGIRGKIFIGGVSKKYFIGDGDGGKYYYINQKSTIRALYLYKKYNCISSKYSY